MTQKELQKREDKLWDYFEKILPVKDIEKLGELIDVNIELEKLCNQ